MNTRLALTAAMTLALTACAVPGQNGYWDNSTHDGSSFERDKAQCIYESQLGTASAPAGTARNFSPDVVTGLRQGELQQQCLRAKGYVWVTR